ncbi:MULTISPECIES: SDR family oxidoreductase [unclassified Hyphomonas]|jgi:NAD(P)-dependent dehydrogenase (short-subunit alcohol dehydrogenase family)|uniref:SDR family NAD(P)-dependent oxidoreductase n=1 Tax=unclassified Hyphomonas TaxID=2630699 RepID=UPI001A8C7824|nr:MULTISPECIES: SDR family oxidoreductase [unclassified Hyphomonas]|tara:strand:+ start:6427 stop:7293 length:867 start_codon:yes stop_codon:yes gene_type:complete
MINTYAGKTCVVTGAGSGIGRELSLELARFGAQLAISDIDPTGVEETRIMLEAEGANVHSQILDIADSAAIYAYPEAILAKFGAIHQLYNNAGISGGGRSIADTSLETIQRVIDINLMGVLHASRAFMPHLESSGSGVLVNISSLNGLVAQPNVAIYCTTKFAVRGLTEAIRTDALFTGSNLQVVVVHPGGVKTNIAKAKEADLARMTAEEREQTMKVLKVYEKKFLTYPADAAAMDILRGVAKGKCRIVVTPQAKQLDRLSRLLPESYPKIISSATKRIQRKLTRNT